MRLHGEGARLRKLWRPLVVNKYLKSSPTARLHIGCGWNNVDGWLNVDKFAANADTYLNAYSKFPFPSESFDKVFSEHMIEHLEVDRLRKFLKEVFRVLKPGGTFRVTCPDLAWMVRGHGGALMTGVVKNFHKHKWMYDYENLSACLQDTGFKETIKQSYGKSIDPELASMDHDEHAFETLYIDAIKPTC